MSIYELAGHLGYLLYAVAYMVRDIFYLRCLAIVASVSFIGFNLFATETPLWGNIFWNSFFIVLNATQILILIFEKREIKFSKKEKELYETVFRHMTSVEFKKIIKMCFWRKIGTGTVLVRQGQKMDSIMLIYNGKTSVSINEKEVAQLSDGNFIGEMSFITEKSATATVRTLSDTEYLIWGQKDLKALMGRNPTLFYSLQAAMGGQIIDKLITQSVEKAAS